MTKSITLGDGACFIAMFSEKNHEIHGLAFIPTEPGAIGRKPVPGTGLGIGDRVPENSFKLYVKNIGAARVLQDVVNTLVLTLNGRVVTDVNQAGQDAAEGSKEEKSE